MRNNNVRKGKSLFVGLLLALSQLGAVQAYSVQGEVDDAKENDQNNHEEPAAGDLIAQPSTGQLDIQQLGRGYTMIFTGKNDDVAVWRWKGDAENALITSPLRPSSMTSVTYNPTNKIIAVGNSVGTVTAYNRINWDSMHMTPLHKESVSQVAFEPGGQLAASASADTTVKLWDPKTGQELGTLEHKAAVQSLAFNPHHPDYLTTVSGEGVVRRWDLDDVKSPKPEVGFEFGGNPQEQANSVAIGPKGKLLAVASKDGKLRYWKAIATKKYPKHVVPAHTGAINTLAFSAQGTLASSGDDAVVKLWDSQQPETCVLTLQTHSKSVQTVAFNPTGTIMASAGDGAAIRLWDVKSGKQITELDGHTAGTTGLEFIAQGKLLISVGHNDTLCVWDVSTGKELDVFKDKERWKLTYQGQHLELNVDKQMEQRMLVQELQDRNAQLQEKVEQLEKEQEDEYENLHLQHFDQDAKEVQELVDRVRQDANLKKKLWLFVEHSKINPKKALIAANALTVLNAAGESFAGKDLRGIHASVCPADDDDQKQTAWQGPDLQRADLRQIDLANADLQGANLTNATFRSQVDHKDLTGHTSTVYGVALSPDGQRVVSGSHNQTVWIWNASNGQQLQQLNGHTSAVYSVAFLPDGQRVVSGSADKTIRIWNASSGQQLQQLNGHTSAVYSVAFSPDGQRVASGSADKTVRIWNASSGQQLQQLNGHTRDVLSIVFSPDGRRVASGSQDNTVRIWNASSGQQLQQLSGHTREVYSVAFSPDGRRVVSGSHDQTIRIWNATSGQQLQQLNGHTGAVYGVSFSPDGQRVASQSCDQTMRLWDVVTSTQLKQFQAYSPGSGFEEPSFSSDGRYLAGYGSNNTVRVWDLFPYLHLNLTGAIGLPPQTLQALQKLGAVVNQADNNDQKEEE